MNDLFPEPKNQLQKATPTKARTLQLVIGAAVSEAPGEEVAGVEGDADEIRGDETELRGAHADDADQGAVDGGNDPTLPESFPKQNRAENREHARDVVKPDNVKQIQHNDGGDADGARCVGKAP